MDTELVRQEQELEAAWFRGREDVVVERYRQESAGDHLTRVQIKLSDE